ncbi:MAG: hypothetical protein Q7J43_05410 [Pseudomonas sp.]|uniref:hypothetical protein n=1 Tax=Pseudomonas sp. TaxID=306 RepID=UPI00271CB605|nr:hypothetical protein [Pseudomonas sp.]MDO9617104.1 hypothetical protein [Pseudomonas sp.]MDZ4291167.1 hypothetical protein [Hydrogenophaga sp.]
MDIFEVNSWMAKILLSNKLVIGSEAFLDISHYLSHDEYEIAFEYLLLELMDHDLVGPLSKDEVISIAVFLGLDKDYHYDENFWEKLNKS